MRTHEPRTHRTIALLICGAAYLLCTTLSCKSRQPTHPIPVSPPPPTQQPTPLPAQEPTPLASPEHELEPPAPAPPLDADAIASALGEAASTTPDGVVRATWPRTEVAVRIDGMPFPPPAGLTSWAAFMPTPHGAMLMGDTVVFQDEVSTAMDAAFAHGLEITALHNHFFFDEPKVYFMHIGGHGSAVDLAQGVKAVWGAIRGVRRERPTPASVFIGNPPTPGGTIDAKAIESIIGVTPSVKDSVVKVSIVREAMMHGARFGGSMGLTTWAAFSGSDAHAAIDGDFAMTAAEVQPVLRALRNAGIHVVALHNHMIGEEPAYYFTHFWAKGPAAELARGFRSVLDAQSQVGKSIALQE